jgi:hypothetical protein
MDGLEIHDGGRATNVEEVLSNADVHATKRDGLNQSALFEASQSPRVRDASIC